MRIIHLKKLTLTNFKGIRSFTVLFNNVTNIYGHNATGKTTIFDAFLWLLFGKDSTDRKDFEIKTLDENNQPYHRLDHEVEAVLTVDGEEIVIKRSLREKWTKKRGSNDQEFTGHETTFFWNEVPMKEKEFQEKIAGILNEKVFKLLTNTNYFNSLPWQERRQVLMQLAGNITNDDVLTHFKKDSRDQFVDLVHVLERKTIPEYKKEIAAKKSKIKDELSLIPARIDEANRSLPEPFDYDTIEKDIKATAKSLQDLEDILLDQVKAQRQEQEAFQDKMTELNELRRSLILIEQTAKNSVRDKKQLREQNILDLKRKLAGFNSDITRLENEITFEEKSKVALQKEQADLREKWKTVNNLSLVFNENEFCCPTCKRSYEATDVEAKVAELTKNFNQDKSRRLEEINERGKKLGQDIHVIETKVSNYKAEIESLRAQVEALTANIKVFEEENTRLSGNEEQEVWSILEADINYSNACAKVKQLEEEINSNAPAASDNTELLKGKASLSQKLDELKKQLASKEQRERGLARIQELETSEREMSQELTRLEGIEFSIAQFEKAQMDLLEARINNRFKIVKFKLFETQINGGEVPCCITLINGVPYPDANTASKAQAGLDIINVLSAHYGVAAPVFFDNRESVVEIPDTTAQIINLIVKEGAKLSVDKIEWMKDYAPSREPALV